MLERWKEKARALKQELKALAIASRLPGVPWYAKAVAFCVIAYALSPVDLIPDFIPVLGYLDDLLLLPLGILLVRRLIPAEILEEARRRAASEPWARRKSWAVAAAIIGVWILIAVLVGRKLLQVAQAERN